VGIGRQRGEWVLSVPSEAIAGRSLPPSTIWSQVAILQHLSLLCSFWILPKLTVPIRMASDMLSSTSNLTLWETVSACLPALNTADDVSEGTTTTAMRYNHIGLLEKWDIKPELAAFEKLITPVFDAYSAGPNKKRHSAQPESLKVGAEIDLDGRVKDNLVSPVHETLHELQNRAHGMATPLLPTNFQYSSAKGSNADLRPKGSEPDLVIEVADLKGRKRVRIVGEFKSCTACDIASMIDEPWSYSPKGLRNFLGKLWKSKVI